jgi:glycerophosphoryl diester phosphodiesterase
MEAVIDMKPADNLQYYDEFMKILYKYGNIEKTIVILPSMDSLNELRERDTYLNLGLICSNINNSNIYYVKTLGNAFIDCSSKNITSSAVILCHKNNIKVGAWTVDDKVSADKLRLIGVDFLTTNKLLPSVKN